MRIQNTNRPTALIVSRSSIQALLITLAISGYPFIATLSTALGLGSIYYSIAMRAFVLFVSIFLLLRSSFYLKPHQFKYFGLFIIFWTIYLFRLTVDTVLYPDQLSRAPSEYWLWALGVCLIPTLSLVSAETVLVTQKAFKFIWISLGVSALLAISYGSTFVTNLEGMSVDTGRSALESLNPISMGHLGASLVIISGWHWISAVHPNKFNNLASITSVVLGSYLLIIAASRGPFIALAIVITAFLFTLKLKRLKGLSAVAILALLLLVIVAIQSFDFDDVALLIRIANISSSEDLSVLGRHESFSGAWNQFISNPLTGDFIDERSTGFYPHNMLLEALMSTGLIGGLAFLSFTVIAIWKSYVMVRDRQSYAWIGLIFIQYCVGSQFSGALYLSDTFWIFSVLAIFATKKKLKIS